jgi:sortase (surface protein transpeptidase)
MEKRQTNYRNTHISVPTGQRKLAVPPREQLLATPKPMVVAEQTVSQINHSMPQAKVHRPNLLANKPVTLDNINKTSAIAQTVNSAPTLTQHIQYAIQPTAQTMPVAAQLATPTGSAPVPAVVSPNQDALITTNKKHGGGISARLQKILPKDKPASLRYGIVAFFVILAGFLAYDTWFTNQQIQSVFEGDKAAAVSQITDDSENSNSESANTALNSFSDYKVGAGQVRLLTIAKIGVSARVTEVGLDGSGKIDTPKDQSFAGVYKDGAMPGGGGATFITGHYDGINPAVFNRLGELAEGDKITIEMGNGDKFNYKVVAKEQVATGQVNMAKALLPYGDANEGLNIMSCAGTWNGSSFSDRITVYAKRI